ncbi:MAG: hypothetical protein ACD_56C00155G0001, partial [uncultured bacterium]
MNSAQKKNTYWHGTIDVLRDVRQSP